MSALSPRQLFLLDEACRPIEEAFGECAYLVGTCAEGNKEYRDVDVRLILPDAQYNKLRAAIGQAAIEFLGFAIGEYLFSRTHLPIDFQFQRQTEANSRHNGVRNPLGVRNLSSYKGDAPPEADHDHDTD